MCGAVSARRLDVDDPVSSGACCVLHDDVRALELRVERERLLHLVVNKDA